MGKIIAVANQKGGVGKTTTTINLSAAIAEKDRKVLLVDLDSQSNATSGVGVEKNEVEISTYDLISGEASFDKCVIHTEFKNLDVIPSSPDLTAAEIELLEETGRESKLKEVLDRIKDQYEFILIDCPPSLSLLTVNALAAADSVLVPIQCEYYALEGLSQLLQTISLVKERINADLKIEGIVFTMYDPRVRLSGQVVQNVKANLKERTFKTLIPRNVRLAEAPSHGKPIMYYTRFCSGTRAYRNLAKEVVAVYEAELSELEKAAQAKAKEEAEITAAEAAAVEETEPAANTEESSEESVETLADLQKEVEAAEEAEIAEVAKNEEEDTADDMPEVQVEGQMEMAMEASEPENVSRETSDAEAECETADSVEGNEDDTEEAPVVEAEENTEENASIGNSYLDLIAKAEKEINGEA